jgi:hypothetical protein
VGHITVASGRGEEEAMRALIWLTDPEAVLEPESLPASCAPGVIVVW